MAGKRYHQHRWVQHDWQRKEAFGLKSKDKWPDKGLPERVIYLNGVGVRHMVLAKGEELNGTKYRGRRAVACCTICSKWVCAGHYEQHLQACVGV